MSCCGRTAPLVSPTPHRLTGAKPQTTVLRPSPRSHGVVFEYLGTTALTAIGPVSGQRYRFERPGARLKVDARDRPGLAQIANLKLVI